MLYLERDELLTKKGFPLIDHNPSLVKFQEALVQRCSVKKVFLEISQNLQNLRQSLFFDKVASLMPATLLRERLWHRCFPVNYAKFLRAPFFIEHVWMRASEYFK